MDEKIISGLVAGAGALAYNLWGLYNQWVKTFDTPVQEVWDWRQTISAIIPSMVLGFIAGYQMSPGNATEYFALLSSGFGVASAQSKAGMKNFFK